ncbi:glycosyltransferase family 4 protein [Candidatus Saccharibacteria bacterium]|nr:glycosyltransferase family 4 protein [Candidatus Saccharibacteria bacterium]
MHIVIDARIRQASTGRPVDRLLEYLQEIDKKNKYTILIKTKDEWRPKAKNFSVKLCKYRIFSFNPFQQLSFAWQLYKLKPDLVHFTLTGQQPIGYFGKQTTFTHDLTMLSFARPGKYPSWLHSIRMIGYRFLFWQSHRKATKILVPTEYVRDVLYKRYLFVRRKLVVTLEASEPPINEKAEPLEGVDKPFILHVGSPFPHKNIERLIQAFEIIHIKMPSLTLVLAGKKEHYFKKLEKSLVGNPLRDSIVMPGFVSSGELKWLYENTECYILPSLSEGFGLPGLEAMVHGCPLVSSNSTCLPEVYGDAAEYFNPYDIEEMSKSIMRVINGPKTRSNLIKEGNKRVKLYSWKTMAEKHLEAFTELNTD